MSSRWPDERIYRLRELGAHAREGARKRRRAGKPSPVSIAAQAPVRPVVDCVVLKLPTPPSVNRLHMVAHGRVIRTPEYRAWISEAGWAIVRAKPRPGRIDGRFAATLQLCAAETRIDADNGMKAVLDLLEEFGIVSNDRLADSVHILWGSAGGAIVTVEAVRQSNGGHDAS
jgi:Holliday junction resolvase RusA-like endonuclease